MLEALNGETLLVPILGDPIAQVKSPAGVTQALEALGHNAVCVPMHVAPTDIAACFAALRSVRNVAGIIVTIPHKLAAFEACDEVTPRSAFLGSVNMMIRTADGRLVGDMSDGIGHVAAACARGCVYEGRRALLIGAGGAGTAIAHAAASAGLATLSIFDADAARATEVAGRLADAGFKARAVSAADVVTERYDIVMNATPLGMRPADPLPYARERLAAGMFVSDVITKPDPSPLIVAARAAGCGTSTGVEMFGEVRDLIIAYLRTAMDDAKEQHA